jgi:imidazolonepropionase-like amidohydrolase
MLRSTWCFLFFVVVSPLFAETFVVRSKWMLDVQTGELITLPAILIRDGKIVDVTSGDPESLRVQATVIDLGDMYLLPGLIDAHVHLAWVGQDSSEDARKTLMAGFTTVRNPGSTGRSDIKLRDEINAGKVAGPRMFVSGPGLGKKDGICDQVFSGEGVIQTPEEAKKIVEALAKENVNFIKICAGGPVVPTAKDASVTEMPDAVIGAIVAQARANGLTVAAHAQGPDAIVQSVRAKVTSIEHGALIDENAAELMKKNHTYLVPTLYRLKWLVENAQQNNSQAAAIERLEGARKMAYDNIRKAIALGVPIAFGTDATVYPHGLNAREFSVLVELGMSPLQAIQAATIHASKLIGWQNQVGQVRAGYFADLIAVSENPLKNIRALENVRFVMKGGTVVKSAD